MILKKRIAQLLPYLFLICFIGTPLPALAGSGSSCPAAPMPHVSMESVIESTTYKETKSARDLAEWSGNENRALPLGLSVGETGLKLNARYAYKPSPDKQKFCLNLENLEAVYYAKPQINIASNFPKTTCEYGVIMGHEQEHVRILQQFHRDYKDAMREQIQETAKKYAVFGPVDKADLDGAQEKALGKISAAMESYREEILKDLKKRQDAIDTTAEYVKLNAKCNSWDKRLSDTP